MNYNESEDYFWTPYETRSQTPQQEMTNHPFKMVKEWFQAVFPNAFFGEKA